MRIAKRCSFLQYALAAGEGGEVPWILQERTKAREKHDVCVSLVRSRGSLMEFCERKCGCEVPFLEGPLGVGGGGREERLFMDGLQHKTEMGIGDWLAA